MIFREVEKLLVSNGSHYIYKSNNKDVIIVVPRHKGDIPKGTLKSFFKQAGL